MGRKALSHGGVFADEAFAGEYARKHRKMAQGLGRRYGRELRRRGFSQGRILDVGCGFGATNLTLAEEFPAAELVGIDLSEPLLSLAREEAERGGYGRRVRFEKADVQEIPFPEHSFDALLNLNMAHLVDDPVRMFGEMERVLRPDGFLFVADLRRSFLGVLEREIRSAFSAGEARNLIQESMLRPGRFSAGILWWYFEATAP